MGDKDTFARYQEQSLHVQLRIPFTRRIVGVVLETPGGNIARLMREGQARLEATREQDLAVGRQAAYEFWESMRRDGVNVDPSRLAPRGPAEPAAQPGQAAAASRTTAPVQPGPQLNAEIPGARVSPVISEIEPG